MKFTIVCVYVSVRIFTLRFFDQFIYKDVIAPPSSSLAFPPGAKDAECLNGTGVFKILNWKCEDETCGREFHKKTFVINTIWCKCVCVWASVCLLCETRFNGYINHKMHPLNERSIWLNFSFVLKPHGWNMLSQQTLCSNNSHTPNQIRIFYGLCTLLFIEFEVEPKP